MKYCINGESCVEILHLNISYLILKSNNNVVKFHVHISPVFSCRVTYYETIKLLDPIVSTLLSEICTAAKDEMKALDPSTVGSWQRAITTSDGAWLTRGRFAPLL